MQKVAIAGIGFMGWIHWLAYQQIPNVKVVAIATPEPDRQAGDWTSIQGNFGPPGEKVCLDGIAVYGSLDQMLADPAIEIDLVDVCLPPALHADAIVAATSSGNHVLCEKPLALKLDQCDRAVDSASSNQVRLFVGQVLPFFTEFQFAFDKIKSGEFGKLIGGSFRRVISDPQWLPKFYDPDVIGGPLFDLHVHDAHFIRLLFGMPLGVFSAGRHRNGVVDYCHSLFKFDDPEVVVHSTTGVINQQGRPFTHGFEIHLENGTLQFDFQGFSDTPEMMPLKILNADGSVTRPELGDGDPVLAFVREIKEVVHCLEQDQSSEILGGRLARDAIEICELQSRSVTSGKYQPAG